jgi:hypothetical protein
MDSTILIQITIAVLLGCVYFLHKEHVEDTKKTIEFMIAITKRLKMLESEMVTLTDRVKVLEKGMEKKKELARAFGECKS